MRNKKDVIIKKRKREKVSKERKIKPGKVVGIVLAVVMVILAIVLFYFFYPRVSRFNVITLRDGAVVDVGSNIEIRKSESDLFWQIYVQPGDRIRNYSYRWGTDESLSEELTDLGDGYMAYVSRDVEGHSGAAYSIDHRDLVIDDDFTIFLIEDSIHDYFSYVAYVGTPEEGAAAFAELSRYVDVTEYGVQTDPFAGLLAAAKE